MRLSQRATPIFGDRLPDSPNTTVRNRSASIYWDSAQDASIVFHLNDSLRHQ
jgi:hypothetical protein